MDFLKETETVDLPDWMTSDPSDRDLPLADRKPAKPAVEVLWVAWIPTGKGPFKDEGAVVGTEWACRKKAAQWLKADDVVQKVYLAPIDAAKIVHGQAERAEPVVGFSDDQEF